MNELNKLIEQYEKENKLKLAKDSYYCLSADKDIEFYTNDFVLWLASRPTCGVEQRKFLDVLGLKGKFSKTNYAVTVGEDDDSLILGSDFYLLDVARNQKDYVDFEKVIKGK